jgi:hypothetical protein
MDSPVSTPKKIAFWAVIIVLLVAFLEILSLVACRKIIPARVTNRASFRSPQDYIIAYRNARTKSTANVAVSPASEDPGQRPDMKMFHPALGWDYPPGVEYTDAAGIGYRHGPKGERRMCTSFGSDLIATYGDSFTYCSDVEDCQTWQTYLAEMVGANVLNFGVAGYGTDQACLKYELNAARVSTPVVMLGILPDNINRIVNVFRTFYAPEDRLALTKPRFVRTSNGFELLPNPITRPEDVARLEDPVFVAQLGEKDHWYQNDAQRPAFGFPYLLTLFRWRTTLEKYAVFNLGLARPGSTKPFYPGNLFEEEESLAVMAYIVDRFVNTARSRGSTPVIVLMPHKELIEETVKYGMSRIDPLADRLKRSNYLFIDLIRGLADMRPSADQLATWYREHATAEGNQIIAEIIARYLGQQGLASRKSENAAGVIVGPTAILNGRRLQSGQIGLRLMHLSGFRVYPQVRRQPVRRFIPFFDRPVLELPLQVCIRGRVNIFGNGLLGDLPGHSHNPHRVPHIPVFFQCPDETTGLDCPHELLFSGHNITPDELPAPPYSRNGPQDVPTAGGEASAAMASPSGVLPPPVPHPPF